MSNNSTSDMKNDSIGNSETQEGNERAESQERAAENGKALSENDAQPIQHQVGSPDSDSGEKKEPDNGDTEETIGDQIKKKQIINSINENYAVIMVGGKCRVMQEYVNPVFNCHDINILGISDFNAFFSNQYFFPSGKKTPIGYAKMWLTSKDRRQYDGIVFMPPSLKESAVESSTYYNLWREFGIEPKKGEWNLFKHHIYANICNEDEYHWRWMMKWLARIVQDPGGERPGVAVVLMGKRGTGKSIFARMLRPIFGQHFIHLSNSKSLTGNFNSHLKDKLVVFCDEGFWSGNKSDEGVLKALITEPTLLIEEKGQDIYEIKNHINLIVATNNELVIPAGLEERRFFVLDVSDRHMQDKPYFKAICDQMENGGFEAMLHDLLEWNDPEINLREAPKTEALMSQIEFSMTPIQKWWHQRLLDGEIPEGTTHWHESLPTSEVHEDYLKYVSKLKLGNAYLTPRQFGKQLRKIAPSLRRFRASSLLRRWMYGFSELNVHRKEFQGLLGFSLDWDAED